MHGIMKQLEFGALYSSAIGMFHSWHQTILTLLSKMSTEVKGTAFIDAYADQLIASQRESKMIDTNPDGPSDFITKFLTPQRENPEKMTDKDIRVSIGANLGAGSYTTSITLSAILYHLYKNPETMKKLREELDRAAKEGTISDPINFKEAQDLSYLHAVTKEGLRIHPATGLTMPRIVPEGGKEIMGRYFPGDVSAAKEIFIDSSTDFRRRSWASIPGSHTATAKSLAMTPISSI
jgi:cytochrome P450